MRHPVDYSFGNILLISCQITCFSSRILQNQVKRKCYGFYMNMDIKGLSDDGGLAASLMIKSLKDG